GVSLHHWLGPCEGGGGAANHHGQLAVLRARLSARHRRIEEGGASCGAAFREVARQAGGAGGVVDDNLAWLQCLFNLAEYVRHIGVIAQAHEDELCAIDDARQEFWRSLAALACPGGDPLRRAIPDGDLMALVAEMARHWPTHHAQSEICANS